MTDALGWMATAVFVASYLFSRPSALRAVQAGGAALWVVYGVAIGSPPVIAANLLVGAAACWASLRRPTHTPAPRPVSDARR